MATALPMPLSPPVMSALFPFSFAEPRYSNSPLAGRGFICVSLPGCAWRCGGNGFPFSFGIPIPPLMAVAVLRRARFHDDLDAAVLLALEHLVGGGSLLMGDAVADDEGGVDLVPLDQAEQGAQVLLHVGLSGVQGEPLGEDGPHRHLVDEAAVHPGDGNRPRLAAGLDQLPERRRP